MYKTVYTKLLMTKKLDFLLVNYLVWFIMCL